VRLHMQWNFGTGMHSSSCAGDLGSTCRRVFKVPQPSGRLYARAIVAAEGRAIPSAPAGALRLVAFAVRRMNGVHRDHRGRDAISHEKTAIGFAWSVARRSASGPALTIDRHGAHAISGI
jgi:hypothetical protein